jgi:uncharacterized repeat protein (TIGR03803 family)
MKRILLALAVLSASTLAQNAQQPTPPATVTTLVNFHKSAAEEPLYGTLVQGKDGNLYGTTSLGGTSDLGTVFKLTTTGKLTVLHSFTGTDGQYPEAGVTLGIDGNFYGMTNYGVNIYGTVFKITRAGALTTLDEFDNTANGDQPTDTFVQGRDGNFYGTTSEGGNGSGIIFKVTPRGALTTLHQFVGTDGAQPSDTLVQGGDGDFYGTTVTGGINHLSGTIFKITPAGTLTTLYNFCAQSNCTDGAGPEAGLAEGIDGNFYGTTTQGGTNSLGTVFKFTPSGELTTLYSFCSQANCADGEQPEAGLVQGTDGNFYGTTIGLGVKNYGTVYQITPSGTLTTLYNFSSTDGSYPYGGLMQHTSGTFYGVTYQGGTGGVGTVFSLNMGLGPFVKLLPTFGKVGRTITILGTNLTGVTSVSFNGTPATFNVPTSTYLTATVPTGATSGSVQVVTSGGTLLSDVAFQVAP